MNILITLTLLLATLAKAAPCCLKIAQFFSKRSFLSIPSLLGKAPTKTATSISLRPSSTSTEAITPFFFFLNKI